MGDIIKFVWQSVVLVLSSVLVVLVLVSVLILVLVLVGSRGWPSLNKIMGNFKTDTNNPKPPLIPQGSNFTQMELWERERKETLSSTLLTLSARHVNQTNKNADL